MKVSSYSNYIPVDIFLNLHLLILLIGSGLELFISETGEHICTYKTTTASPIVTWAPNRYALAYADGGSLRVVGFNIGGK